MRLDKFLKLSRIIKRRSVAKEVCDLGNISLGDKVAKAGTEVKSGDVLTIKFGNRNLTVRIVSTPEVVRVQEAPETYEILNEISN
jgi:ribosomal 50S subunit-recycling heat shock protein